MSTLSGLGLFIKGTIQSQSLMGETRAYFRRHELPPEDQKTESST